MTRPPLLKVEKFLLIALAAQFLFTAWISYAGTLSIDAGAIAFTTLVLLVLALVIGAVTFILRRNPLGGFLCIVFHALQLVQWAFDNGGTWKFAFFPTVTIRLNADLDHPVQVNLLAVLLTLISILGYKMRREANETPPATAATG